MDGLTNPLLDEINGLSPGAKAALQSAHNAGTSQATTQATMPNVISAQTNPPKFMGAQRQDLSSPAPDPSHLFSRAPMPILAPPNPGFAAARQSAQPSPAPSTDRMLPPSQESTVPSIGMGAPQPQVKAPLGTGTGDISERARLLNTGTGVHQIQDHPVLKAAAGVGDYLLSNLLPGPASQIPGTTAHHNFLLGQNTKQTATDLGNEQKQATTGATQAEIPLRQAQTAEAQVKATDQPGLDQAEIAEHNAQAAALLHPQAKTDFEAWQQQNPGKPIEEWLKAQTASKNLKPKPEQQFIDEFTAKNPNGTIAEAVHAYASATQKPERGPTFIQQNSEVDRLGSRLGKPYETMNTQGGAKLDRIDQTARSVDAGYVGQGLAIPELLTSLVSGQGTGVRITQPELNAITAARGIKGDAESFFNKLAGKGKLTDEDKTQFKAVLADAKTRMGVKLQVVNDALDKINGASSREEVMQADKEARQKFMQIEKYGHYEGEQVTIKGNPVVINKIHPDGSFE